MTEFEFDTCRNAAKHAARGEWIVSLDLDEKLLVTGQKLVDSLKLVPKNVDSLRVANVSLKTSNVEGIPEAYTGLAVRIFRNEIAMLNGVAGAAECFAYADVQARRLGYISLKWEV